MWKNIETGVGSTALFTAVMSLVLLASLGQTPVRAESKNQPAPASATQTASQEDNATGTGQPVSTEPGPDTEQQPTAPEQAPTQTTITEFGPAELAGNDIEANSGIAQSAAELRAAVARKDQPGTTTALNKLVFYKNRLQTRNMPFLAKFLAAEAASLAAKSPGADSAKTAIELLKTATKVSPDSSAAWYALSKGELAAGSIPDAAKSAMTGFITQLNGKMPRDTAMASVYSILAGAIALGSAVIFLTIFLDYARLSAHDLARKIAPSEQEKSATGDKAAPQAAPVQQKEEKLASNLGLMLLMALVPLAIGGPGMLLLASPVLIWGYMWRRAKIAVVIAGLLLLLVPYLAGRTVQIKAGEERGAKTAAELVQKGTWDMEAYSIISRQSAAQPADRNARFLLALLQRYRGEYEPAAANLESILAKNPADLKALVNLGNVRLLQEDYTGAAHYYSSAIAVDNNDVTAHYNLAIAYEGMFRTQESDAEFKVAQGLNPEKVQEFVHIAEARGELDNESDRLFPDWKTAPATTPPGSPVGAKVIDFTVPPAEFESATRAEAIEYVSKGTWASAGLIFGGNIISTLLGTVASAIPAQSAPMAIFAIAIGLFILSLLLAEGVWRKTERSDVCISCGTVYQSPTKLEPETAKCNQCLTLTFKKHQVQQARKDQKLREIRNHISDEEALASKINYLFPGIGKIYLNQYFAGVILVFLSALMLELAIKGVAGILLGAAGGGMEGSSILFENAGNIILILAAGLYYLAAVTLFRPEHK